MAVGGRSPGFVTAVQYYPEDDTTIIVLTNSYSSMAQDPIVGDIAALVYDQPTRSGPVAPLKPAPGQFAGIAGRYQMPSNYYAPDSILALQDRGDYMEARWEHGEVNVIYPVSADECLDRMYWARLRFQRDPAGKVTGFTYHLVQDFQCPQTRLTLDQPAATDEGAGRRVFQFQCFRSGHSCESGARRPRQR